MLRTADLDYDLPDPLIATRPAEPRDAARLMVVSRSNSSRAEHLHVRDLPGLLSPDDLLVFNTTRVVPARLVGVRADSGGRVEGLYLRDGEQPGTWVLLVQGKRPRTGVRLTFAAPKGGPAGTVVLIDRVPDEAGAWLARVEDDEPQTLLARIGRVPLPPYIRRARRGAGQPEEMDSDRDRYQTVYAREPGSVAAPTAGLHFTAGLLATLAARRVERADVTLDVGVGTFRPVEAEMVDHHPIHAEWCSMSPAVRERLSRPRRPAPRVTCVGTTAARTVETYAALPDCPGRVSTRLLITPGYRWRWTDGLLTNFHLPRSSLMAMVAALLPGGAEQLKRLYAEAVARGYRFYSYGDAMLVLP
ncbi:MAG: tRNA preQ1(34) S-adenosylmethionine ribosyltransferase-isomerase QueA [Phycisphaerales bacterium]|nr:tRNA preQ1(34) S-adenosylmethionine ribosyltransferase-isomerase QueA [Phycisphaerales bacterium]